MMKITATLARLGLGLVLGTALLGPAAASEEESATPTVFPIRHPELEPWSFAGIFGKYDTAQLQRGYQVYKEVCAACHSMHLLSFRNLAEEGGPHFTEAQAQAVAASYQVQDGPNDAGDMFERPGRLSDRFPSPFPNPEAAAAATYSPRFGVISPDFPFSRRTSPVSATLHSWVSVPNTSQAASGTSARTTTACRIPVPSRTTANPILPFERRCVTQARTVTV